ncbi:NAD(P)H-binding protein [Labedaea rhizosphaerae]|uniref:NAD(P)H dehydrogenase (Quinone) n=1 Tax=Labedaea rhizosphaerae TaxID=598644 RepID=A0A4R6SLQ7_LABRH|nr:NAD(P)H-binding protein [Labedaea rhizosphaerae]TDQ04490.1 NAD(P)H dehydrogenase (quinone) [Labedaea rhizosphaerae]
MTILLTGANGHYGRLVADRLLDRVPASELIVSVRDTAKAADLAERGVTVRHGDFDDPASLDFTGADRMLLVSTDGPDDVRIGQHEAAVEAAAKAGVRHLAYSSVTDADTSPVSLARVHAATEKAIRASGLAFTFLRNGMYSEHFAGGAVGALEHGVLLSASGEGGLAAASRADLAAAAAIVLTTDGHEGKVYELTGPRAWTSAELAELVSAKSGKPLAHKDVSGPELVEVLRGAGLPGFLADLLVDIQLKTRDGVFARTSPDLGALLGRAPATVEDAVTEALA